MISPLKAPLNKFLSSYVSIVIDAFLGAHFRKDIRDDDVSGLFKHSEPRAGR
jgi:hypothetical protein